MASFRDRMRDAAATPAGPRTAPGTLRALVRRRRRTRRAVATALSVVVLATAGTVAALLAQSPNFRVIEFADAPSPTAVPSAPEEPTADDAGEAPATPAPTSPPDEDDDVVAPQEPSDSGGETEPPPGCTGPARASDMPPGANARQIIDVDGDDRRDIMWLDADRNLGIITAAGAADVFAIDSAAPSTIEALAVDADEQPPVELLVDDGRTTQLLVFDDCGIRPVINTRDGEPWLFDRGFRGVGTGVGCVDIGGRRRLVGLNIEQAGDDAVEWSRTVVNLDRRSATVGRTDRGTFDRPDDDYAIELLSQVTCGDLTMPDDGLSTPTP